MCRKYFEFLALAAQLDPLALLQLIRLLLQLLLISRMSLDFIANALLESEKILKQKDLDLSLLLQVSLATITFAK